MQKSRSQAFIAAVSLLFSPLVLADLSVATLADLKKTADSWGEIARVANYCKMSSESLARYLTLHATKYYGANRAEVAEILRAYANAGANIDLPRIDCAQEKAKTQPLLDDLKIEVLIYECWDITKQNLKTCTDKYRK